MKLRVGDKVLVTTGKDKGKQGLVKVVKPARNSVVVEGVNKTVKHKKPLMGQAGERVVIEKPIAVSKLAILNQAGEADRIGFKLLKDGSKVRVFRKSGGLVDTAKSEKPAAKTSSKKK